MLSGGTTLCRANREQVFLPDVPGVESDKPGNCPKCGMALERNPAWQPPQKIIYTCPMHPEIEQDHPGDCPKCGMALEPKTVAAETGRGRFGTARHDAPVLDRRGSDAAGVSPRDGALVPGCASRHWVDERCVSRWMQFALSTPVVLWAGWPFFERGWRSLVTRHLNMFTLIAIGVGAAYVSAPSAMLVPGHFPAVVPAPMARSASISRRRR